MNYHLVLSRYKIIDGSPKSQVTGSLHEQTK